MRRFRFLPMFYIALINIIGFLMLFFFTEGQNNTYLYTCVILCGINIIMYILLYFLDYGDLYLFLTVSMLVSIGLIMLCRLDIAKNTSFGQSQILWFIIGIVVYFITLIIFAKLNFWSKLRYVYMALTFALIGLTAVMGTEVNGSKNWIFLPGNISIQPSEFIKILFCLAISCYFSAIPTAKELKKKDTRMKFMGIPIDEIILCVYVYACMGSLALFQKEWGTALLLFLIYFAMCFVYKTSIILKCINLGGITIAGLVGFLFLADHIGVRVTAWQDPWQDPQGAGFQIINSLMAIASGGYFGKGIGNGMPYIIPEAQNDFIFAAICEEMGIFIGFAIIMLYFILSYRGVKLAIKSSNEYTKAMCLSLVIAIGFQTFIIIAGVIKLIPMTGITLPFISSGGSSMMASFIMLGIMSAAAIPDKKPKR
ncbi:MAG: FtsW/RodA/SpoVE family cell cycle protein [Clostridia bacterium]|nr:FtsW/RodA/SpoVE family cell cycle protein [Clostridia bacterium]